MNFHERTIRVLQIAEDLSHIFPTFISEIKKLTHLLSMEPWAEEKKKKVCWLEVPPAKVPSK